MDRIKVLVVEDEEPLLKAIMNKMETLGVESRGAQSVEEARKGLKEFSPNLVWLDHYLHGDEDGMVLLKEIRRDRKTKRLPVFVVSNTCSVDKYNEYLESGISKYYTKSSAKLSDIILEAKSCLSSL